MNTLPAIENIKLQKVKNIVVVDDTADDFGGSAQVAYVTARVLADRGYNVVYFAGSGPVHKRLTGIRVITVNNESFLNNHSKIKGAWNGLSSKQTYHALCDLLSDFDSTDTVLHIHSWTHALSSSIFNAIADMGFKSLVTLHDYFLTCPNGGYYNYKRHEICHLKPCSFACIARNCDKRNYAQKIYRVARISIQTKAIARAKPRFAYLSEFTYHILRNNQFDDGNPLFLPNPVEIQGKYCASPISSRKGYLFIGRMDPEKNPALFCEALTTLNLPGTLCGDGPLLSELRKQYPNLNFLGWCDKDELIHQARSCKALIMTSSWLEASPLVCLEAMLAAGIPSIVPNTCGAIDYIKNGKNGVWFENGSVKSLCKAIKLIEDDNSYERICDKINENLPALRHDRSYECYANKIIEIYENLLQPDKIGTQINSEQNLVIE